MKQIIAFIFVLVCLSPASAQNVINHQIGDDGFAEVPLQFAFPYYGQVFTNSWMFDNGVVGFYSPFDGFNGGQDFFSQPFSSGLPGRYNYMIAPLWTDLINYSGTFTTQGDKTFQRYSWNNISQWAHPDRLNSFSLEITPSGSISVEYDQINIQGYPVSVGTSGDLSQGQFEQVFYASSNSMVTTNSLSDWQTYTEADVCAIDVLSSSECPGYEAAYFNQQCSVSSLYDSQCPGYELAYFDQQCSADPLYNNQCPGYEVAYFDQQCSIDALYNNQCPGYQVAYVLANSFNAVDNTIAMDNQVAQVQEMPADVVVESVVEPEIYSVESVAEVFIEAVQDQAEDVVAAESASLEERAATPSSSPAISSRLLSIVLNIVQNQQGGSSQNNNTASDSILTNMEYSQQFVAQADVSDSGEQVLEESSDVSLDNVATLQENNIASIIDNNDIVIQTATIDLNEQVSENAVDNLFNEGTAFFEVDTTNDNVDGTFFVEVQQLQQIQTSEIEISQSNMSGNDSLDQDQQFLNDVATSVQESTSVPTTAVTSAVFANNNMEQLLALGGNITQILNTATPDFSRFEIKPPSADEQLQSSRVEGALVELTDEELEMQITLRVGDMDPAAQSVLLQIMAYYPGFDQYGGNLSDQSNWYQMRGVYTNNRVPNSSSSNLIFGAQDQRHQELMSLQYGR